MEQSKCMEQSKDLITYIVKAVVEHTDDVAVVDAGQNEEGTYVLELRVAPVDRGKVIGKKGCMAQNMRTLLAACCPEDRPTTLEIMDS